jgi:hypothetical protein
MKKRFTVTWCPAMLYPLLVRIPLVAAAAKKDAQAGFYACRDVITHWLGHFVVWDVKNNAVHKLVSSLLELPAAYVSWQSEREAVEKDLATRANYYVLLALLILLFVSDTLSNLLLLKNLGVEEGLRRLLMAFAVAAVLFAIPVIAVKFFEARSKVLSWIAGILGVVLVAVISIVQLQQTSSSQGSASLGDLAGSVLLSFAVVGPAALAKLVLGSWFPIAQLRAERRRLIRLQDAAKTAQRNARRYVTEYLEYTHWYKSNAKQIASVYRPAFAREYLQGSGNHDQLAKMIAADDVAIEREIADKDNADTQPQPVPAPVLQLVPSLDATDGSKTNATGKPRQNAAEELKRLEDQFARQPKNPYRKQS